MHRPQRPPEPPPERPPQRPRVVLLVHFGDADIRGSEQLLIDLLGALDQDRYRPVLWCNAAALAQAARALGVETHCAPMRFIYDASASAADVAAVWRQIGIGAQLVRLHRPALVHVNGGAPVQWMALVCCRAGLPLLVHVHSPYLRRNRFNQLLHLATLVVGVSAVCLDGLRHDAMPAARLRLIPNGIDAERLAGADGAAARARWGIPADAPVVGVAGSLIERKQTAIVLTAFAALRADPPPWLLVAGDGPERPALSALAVALGIAPRTVFTGPYSDAATIFATMDINVLASRDEAFGLVLVEAALCQVPSVAGQVGGIVEVIVPGQTGLLVPPDDPAAFAAATQSLLDDRALRTRMGTAARTRAREHFSVGRMAADIAATYDQLVALPRAALGWRALWSDTACYRRLLADLVRRA